MSAVDTFPCPVTKGRKHEATWLSGFCSGGTAHDRCSGVYTHPCGCTVLCRCDAPGHPDDRPHPCQETTVVLPDPFTIPTEPGLDGPEGWRAEPEQAAVAQNGPSSEVANREPDKPWRTGTGAGAAPLEVMVRAFAMAAGDLHLHDDRYEDYDETAVLAMLGILRASVKRAQELDALLVTHLHEHGTWGRRIVDGLGEVRTYRRPKSVRWDERGTAEAVIEHHMVELGGEQPDPLLVLSWLLEVAAIDYYRTGALKALGIDPEDYRHSEKGTRAVDVPVPD